MGDFGAIPSKYNGWNLDSQLERGYAGYMHFNDWEVEHEPEGYCEGDIWYRPDFLLHHVNIINYQRPCRSVYDADVFIEVKGDPQLLPDAFQKARLMQKHGFHVLIVGRFPYGENDESILKNWKSARAFKYEGGKSYSSYTLFQSWSECGGTKTERRACEEGFLKATNRKEKYDLAKWEGYYGNLKNYGLCPKYPKIIPQPMYLWVGRNGEPIIGNWHTRSDRTDGDPGNTLEAIKYALKIMDYKVRR